MLRPVNLLQKLAGLCVTSLLLFVMNASAASLYEIPVNDIDGAATNLAPYKGNVLLIVNVASMCGFTPQYKELQELYVKRKDAGLVVLGFPCNQFGEQEPGSDTEIKQFCSTNYGVTFPLFDKIEVNGEHRHPLYVELAGKDSPFPGNIPWNFTKFVVGRDGRIVHRFGPNIKPDAPEVTSAIDAALAAPVVAK
jgi:glutathione peroxidase